MRDVIYNLDAPCSNNHLSSYSRNRPPALCVLIIPVRAQRMTKLWSSILMLWCSHAHTTQYFHNNAPHKHPHMRTFANFEYNTL